MSVTVAPIRSTVTAVTAQGLDAVELEHRVKAMYRAVALNPEKEYHFEMGRRVAERVGYRTSDLDKIPAPAVESFAGVGHFFDLAAIRRGESVIDFGSGSGTDAFIASLYAGKSGRVVGIDMTDEQLEKARGLSIESEFHNAWFQKGYLDQVPCVDKSFDVAISNGVFNLAANKAQVFSEAARVLKPGGRLALADIVSEKQLPDSIVCDTTLWAACIGGAMQEDAYVEAIETAGLHVVVRRDVPEYKFLSNGAVGAMEAYGVKSIVLLAEKVQ